MQSRASKLCVLLFPLLFLLPGKVFANTCNNFLSYDCAHSTPNIIHVGAGVPSGQSVGVLLTSNVFNVSAANGASGADVIVIAAFLNGSPAGSLQGLGLCSTTCSLSFGYVDLHTPLAANGIVTVTASGVPVGTVFYGLVLASNGQIKYITPNSEAAILGRGNSNVIPEPGSLTLLGTGLLGLAGLVRKRVTRK